MLLKLNIQSIASDFPDTAQRRDDAPACEAHAVVVREARPPVYHSDSISELDHRPPVPAEQPSRTLAPSPHEDAVRLAMKLRLMLNESEQVLMFTGAAEGAVTSRVAAEVAAALTQMTNESVALVDAKLHAPTLHDLFDTPSSPGLAEALTGPLPHHACWHETNVANLVLLPGGRRAGRYSLPSAAEVNRLMQSLRRGFRFIVVDAPPLLAFAETVLVAAESDGVVVVLSANQHRRAELINIKHELDSLQRRTLGVVLCEPHNFKTRRRARSQKGE